MSTETIPQTSFVTLSVFGQIVSLDSEKREVVDSLLTDRSYTKISTVQVKDRMENRIEELEEAYTAMGEIASDIVENKRDIGDRTPYETITDPEIIREEMDRGLSENLAQGIQNSTDKFSRHDVTDLADLQIRRASLLRRLRNRIDLVISSQYDWREFQIPPEADRLFDDITDDEFLCHTCKSIFVWGSDEGTSYAIVNGDSRCAELFKEHTELFEENLPQESNLEILPTSQLKHN